MGFGDQSRADGGELTKAQNCGEKGGKVKKDEPRRSSPKERALDYPVESRLRPHNVQNNKKAGTGRGRGSPSSVQPRSGRRDKEKRGEKPGRGGTSSDNAQGKSTMSTIWGQK